MRTTVVWGPGLRLWLMWSLWMSSVALAGPGGTTTNQCVIDLGGVLNCADRGPFGFPRDMEACCAGVRQMAADRCSCNPAIDVLLGEGGTRLYKLESICRMTHGKPWRDLERPKKRSCDDLQTYDYGCEQTDMELDAARLGTLLGIRDMFATTQATEVCFDTPTAVENLDTVFTPDVEVYVPYGIGAYKGPDDVAEYLGISFAGLNHGWWGNDFATIDPTKKARLDVSDDGLVWNQGATFGGWFWRGELPYDDAYIAQKAEFVGCEARATRFEVQATEGLAFWVDRYVQSSQHAKRWAAEDICRYHETYCAPDEATRQYDSMDACLSYINELPAFSEACGPKRPMGGHSLPCKFKHHFMIPTNPTLHCPHIGPAGSADPNEHFKCDDVAECSDGNEGVDWPALQHAYGELPRDVSEALERTNHDYASEPMGCAVPTTPRNHHAHH